MCPEWEKLILKRDSFFICKSNVIGCPIFYLATHDISKIRITLRIDGLFIMRQIFFFLSGSENNVAFQWLL